MTDENRKNKRVRYGLAALAAASVLLLVFAIFRGSGPNKNGADRPSSPVQGFEDRTPAAKELRSLALQYHDRIESIESRLKEYEKQLGSTYAQIQKLSVSLEEYAKAQGKLLDLASRTSSRERETASEKRQAPARIGAFDLGPNNADESDGFIIPAGSFGEGTLLTGVYAPVNGDALPVLIRLDSILIGPSKSRIPIRGAFLVAKANGDANSSRAVIQLHTLSLVDSDGNSIEKKVNGWIVDADGVQGLAGSYVWKATDIAALSIVSGTGQGAANAFTQSNTSVLTSPLGSVKEITGNVGQVVMAQGASQALANISKILEERMKEFVPAIYVSNAARQVTVVFLEGVNLENANLKTPKGPLYGNRFSGLDAFHDR